MKFIYEKGNKQQLVFLIKFYWSVFWRDVVVAVFICPDMPAVSLFISIYLLKYVTLLNHKTFIANWTTPIPKYIFSKRFFYPAFVFSFLASGVFLDIERFAQHSFYATLFIGLACEIFLLHIFILNNWLPFQLIPLDQQDKLEKHS